MPRGGAFMGRGGAFMGRGGFMGGPPPMQETRQLFVGGVSRVALQRQRVHSLIACLYSFLRKRHGKT